MSKKALNYYYKKIDEMEDKINELYNTITSHPDLTVKEMDDLEDVLINALRRSML